MFVKNLQNEKALSELLKQCKKRKGRIVNLVDVPHGALVRAKEDGIDRVCVVIRYPDKTDRLALSNPWGKMYADIAIRNCFYLKDIEKAVVFLLTEMGEKFEPKFGPVS